ncbi:MAG: nickel-responsive transcriptional regulator NikR [Lentisphaeria bacterium]|nr:nickel-responsive transcriptional regulator NikR [Lentisphaeria bacterium]
MNGVARFSVSVEPELLADFDRLVEAGGHSTRSEAVKQLMRGALVDRVWSVGGVVAGAILLVYDHHRRDLVQRLMDVQHEFGDTVISTQHVHLDHDTCMEVITLRGETAQIQALVTTIRGIKGLKHCSLVTTATERKYHES